MSSLNRKILFGVLWQGLERFSCQAAMLIVTILLARFLTPEEFGVVAILNVFIVVADLLGAAGMGLALIQKPVITQSNRSSAFWLNMTIAVVVYLIVAASAPWIESFYRIPRIKQYLWVLGITILFRSFSVVYIALLTRNMLFKLKFQIQIIAVLTSGCLGIICAWMNMGTWALIAQQLTYTFVQALSLTVYLKWWPSFIFSLREAREMFRYGSKLMLSGIINCIFENIYPLIIGKLFSAKIMGYYDRANYYPAIAVNSTNSIITAVMFPAFSKLQNNKERLKETVRETMRMSSFIIFPLCLGMAVTAKPLILVLLTEKWLPCYPMFQISCLIYMLFPLHVINLQVINAIGRSDVMLYLEILKRFVFIVIVLISYRFGIYAMLWGAFVAGLISVYINAHPNKKYISYGLMEQLQDILPNLLISGIMGGIVFLAGGLLLNPLLMLFLQIPLGVAIFTGLCFLFKNKSFYVLITRIRELICHEYE